MDLRWHTKEEYSRLSKEQKSELYQWQQTKNGKEAIEKSKRNPKRKNMTKKQMKAHIQSLEQRLEVEKRNKSDANDESKVPSISEIQALISSAVPLPPIPSSTPVQKPSNKPDENYHLAAAAVQQILKRSRKE